MPIKYTEFYGKGTNPIRKVGSVNWLKYEIRAMTAEFNKRYRNAMSQGEIAPQLKEELERVLGYGGRANPLSKKDVVGLGFSAKGHNKAWLERQWGSLKTAVRGDIWSPDAKEIRTEKEMDAYETFKANQVVDWSYDKWRRMVDLFGNMDSTILHGFGYMDSPVHDSSSTAKVLDISGSPYGDISNSSLVNVYSYAYDKHIDIFSMMLDIEKRPNVTNAREAINELWSDIGEILMNRDNPDEAKEGMKILDDIRNIEKETLND